MTLSYPSVLATGATPISTEDVEQWADEFNRLNQRFAPHFKRVETKQHAQDYLQGLLSAYSHDFGLLSVFGDAKNSPCSLSSSSTQLVRISRLANKFNPARPNIWRFNILRRLFCPSTGPLLTSKVRPALTAS